MTKRRRIILQALLLAPGLLMTQLVEVRFRYLAIFILCLVSYFFTAWSLREDLKKISWSINLPLPALYTGAMALFYFLLPEVWLSRITILFFYAIGLYAVLLVENIYTISASRTIQLVRAAQAVGFLMTLVTGFLFYDAIFSFRLAAFINAPMVGLISFWLILPALWSVDLQEGIEHKIIYYSLILAWVMTQASFLISFWPLSISAVSLFLVAALYVLLGVVQNHFSGRLFEKTLKEYLRVGVVVLIIIFFLARWG